jgi:pSer/pThr/pTyr-binding forkhead associated (FHA) protein
MSAASARLDVVAGNATGMSIVVEDELLIGRQTEGAGRLADDEEISRRHARLALDASGSCAIEDLGSTNGTFVNGLRVTSLQTLSEGDTIELGSTTLVVRELTRLSEAPAAPIASAPPQKTVTTAIPAPAPTPGEAEAIPAPAPTPAPAGDVPIAPPQPIEVERPPATEPDAASEPEPAAAREPELPATLSLKLEVDFGARELLLRFDDTSEPLRLAYDGDSWRLASTAIEKGTPHEHQTNDG